MLIQWETALGDKRRLRGNNDMMVMLSDLVDADMTLTFPEPIMKLLSWANHIYSERLKKYERH